MRSHSVFEDLGRGLRRLERPGSWRIRLAALGGLGWGLIAAGCATTLPSAVMPPPAAPPACLVVENLTDYEWHIAVVATAGAEAWDSRVRARSALEVNLAGGDYLIEQAVVADNPGPALARRVPARLEPGQTYRWRLVTLLSAPPANSGRDGR